MTQSTIIRGLVRSLSLVHLVSITLVPVAIAALTGSAQARFQARDIDSKTRWNITRGTHSKPGKAPETTPATQNCWALIDGVRRRVPC